MSDGNSLVNLGDLTRPATVLIEKISDAVGALYLPRQIRRIAKAEVEAEKIKALANIEITEIQQRGIVRFIEEQGRQQENMESVTEQSIPELKEDAKPEDIENDWLASFFEKCRLVSDKEMQSLWAKLLAGEANSPGTFSKRTVEQISNLDKSDAQLFTSLCGFGWVIGDIVPLVYDVEQEIYNEKGIYFNSLKHLDDIGLITFNDLGGFVRKKFPKFITVFYYGTPINIEFNQDEDNKLQIGKVLLSKAGQELAPICGSVKSDEFMEYVLNEWLKLGYAISSPLRKK